jgi:hypothetical protein
MMVMMAKRRVIIELSDDDARLLDNLVGDACAKQRKPVTISDVVRVALRQSATKAGVARCAGGSETSRADVRRRTKIRSERN